MTYKLRKNNNLNKTLFYIFNVLVNKYIHFNIFTNSHIQKSNMTLYIIQQFNNFKHIFYYSQYALIFKMVLIKRVSSSTLVFLFLLKYEVFIFQALYFIVAWNKLYLWSSMPIFMTFSPTI